MKKLTLLLCFIIGQSLMAQVGIGNTNPQSKLDISASNPTAPANTDGILIPRIDNFPASNPTATQDGMMVFYTGTARSGKGFYYWDNSITDWVYAIGGADTDWTEVGADIERQSGDVYIGDANTTDNNLYISNRIFDWDDTSYWLKPNSQSALSTLQIDNGTSSNPSLHFLSDNTTGISGGTSYINMVTDGVTRHQFTDKGQLEFFFKQSVLLGRNAGENLSATFNDAVFIGEDAGRETTTGSGNIALGRSALVSNTTGSNNISMGSYSMTQNTTGIENIGLGASSLSKVTGSYNVAIGSGAGNIDVNSTQNTYIGRSAGGGTPAQNFSRTGNVFIGTFAGYGQNMSNRLFIENSSATTPLIYGEFDNDVVRVNGELQVNNPTTTGYRLPTVDGTANQIIATDGAGQLSFIDASDNQTIDYLTLSGTTLQLSLEDDGEAPQTVDLSSLSAGDNDWYEVGTSVAPNAITDNIFTNGDVGIGSSNIGLYTTASRTLTVGPNPTASPVDPTFIEIVGATGMTNSSVGGIHFENLNGSSNGDGVAKIEAILNGSTSFAGHLLFYTGNNSGNLTEKMRIEDTGDVGIGVTNPSATLDVVGSFQYEDGNEANGHILRSDVNGNASWVNPNTVFTDTDTDNQQIDIFNLSGTTLQLSLQDDGMATQTVDLSSLSTSDSDWFVQATTNNSTNINDNIYTQGNVGIGLNTPATRLHVDGGTTPFRVDVSGTETLVLNNNTLELKNTNSSTYVGEIVGLNATGANNTGLGYAALRNVTTGTNNTAIGSGSLDAITTASNNTSIGANALTGNGSGENNVAIGVSSLASNSSGENNVAVGYQALTSNTTQGSNNALGYRALASNTNGFGNSAFGYLALESNTTADRNVAFGNQALRAQTTGGFDNVALGYFSLNNNTTGDDNVAVGSQALMANTVSRFNVAIGSDALASTTANGQNVAVGHEALTANTASWNTAMGYRALTANTTGQYNVSIGHSALLANTVGSGNSAMGYQAAGNFNNNGVTAIGYQSLANGTGAENTSIGYRSMATATAGTENVSIGHQSMELATTASQNVSIGYLSLGGAATTGNRNVSIGRRSMFSNTTGGDNVAVGYATLSDNTTGYDNTAVGGAALIENTTGIANTALGEIALENNTTGSNNVGVGKYSGRLNVSGNDNTYIGTDAGHNSTGSSNVHLGYRAGFNNGNSNRLYIDNSDTASPLIYGTFNTNEVGINWNSATALPNTLSVNGNASKSAAGAWLANSDRRLKKNIETIADEKALEKLLSLRGVTYEWDDNQTGIERPEGIQYGFIAQELMEVFPEKVTKDGLGFYQTAYGDYDAVFVQAIKALHNKINNLENENQQLKEQLKQFQNLEARLSVLENISNPINETVEVKNSKE